MAEIVIALLFPEKDKEWNHENYTAPEGKT